MVLLRGSIIGTDMTLLLVMQTLELINILEVPFDPAGKLQCSADLLVEAVLLE